MRIQEGVYVCGVQALHYDLQAMDGNGHGNMWCFGLTVVVFFGGGGGQVGGWGVSLIHNSDPTKQPNKYRIPSSA